MDRKNNIERLIMSSTSRRCLSPEAVRALEEAEERRKMGKIFKACVEFCDLDPVRYGDWEIKGRAIDF
jgi:hypothetical protein